MVRPQSQFLGTRKAGLKVSFLENLAFGKFILNINILLIQMVNETLAFALLSYLKSDL